MIPSIILWKSCGKLQIVTAITLVPWYTLSDICMAQATKPVICVQLRLHLRLPNGLVSQNILIIPPKKAIK